MRGSSQVTPVTIVGSMNLFTFRIKTYRISNLRLETEAKKTWFDRRSCRQEQRCLHSWRANLSADPGVVKRLRVLKKRLLIEKHWRCQLTDSAIVLWILWLLSVELSQDFFHHRDQFLLCRLERTHQQRQQKGKVLNLPPLAKIDISNSDLDHISVLLLLSKGCNPEQHRFGRSCWTFPKEVFSLWSGEAIMKMMVLTSMSPLSSK